jgi:hypothetical protein
MARRKVNVAATLAAAFKLLIKILNGIVVVSCSLSQQHCI